MIRRAPVKEVIRYFESSEITRDLLGHSGDPVKHSQDVAQTKDAIDKDEAPEEKDENIIEESADEDKGGDKILEESADNDKGGDKILEESADKDKGGDKILEESADNAKEAGDKSTDGVKDTDKEDTDISKANPADSDSEMRLKRPSPVAPPRKVRARRKSGNHRRTSSYPTEDNLRSPPQNAPYRTLPPDHTRVHSEPARTGDMWGTRSNDHYRPSLSGTHGEAPGGFSQDVNRKLYRIKVNDNRRSYQDDDTNHRSSRVSKSSKKSRSDRNERTGRHDVRYSNRSSGNDSYDGHRLSQGENGHSNRSSSNCDTKAGDSRMYSVSRRASDVRSDMDDNSTGSSSPSPTHSLGSSVSRIGRRALVNYAVFWGFAVAQMVVAIVLFAVGAVDLILKHGSVDCSSNHYTIYAACIAPGVWAPVLFISAAIVGIKVGPERKKHHDLLIVIYLLLSAICALIGYVVIIVYIFNVVQSLEFDQVEMTMVPASSLIILFVEANLFLVSTIKTAKVLGTHYKSRRVPIPMSFVRQRQREVERNRRLQERLQNRHMHDFERKWVMGSCETLMSIHGNLFARSADRMVTKSTRPSLTNMAQGPMVNSKETVVHMGARPEGHTNTGFEGPEMQGWAL